MKEDEKKLKIYEVLMRYQAYENTTYWTRSNQLLFANSVLLGFVLKGISEVNSTNPGQLYFLTFAGCLAGLYFAYLWKSAIEAGMYWTNRWMNIIQQIEGEAVGELQIMRDGQSGNDTQKRPPTRKLARKTQFVVSGIWILLTFISLHNLTIFVGKTLFGL